MVDRVKTVSGHLGQNVLQFSPTSSLQAQLSVPESFQYTYSGKVLTTEQRLFYEENGFIVIKNTVPKKDIAKYREYFEQICDGEVHVPYLTVMKDVSIAKTKAGENGEKVITKIQNFQDDEILAGYCAMPEIIKYVTDIIGPNCMSMHTMLINKPPDPGTKSSRHPMHQDLNYFPFRPANRIVCAWTAMERVHRDNGCLVVVPGTHQGELLEHGYPEWEGGIKPMMIFTSANEVGGSFEEEYIPTPLHLKYGCLVQAEGGVNMMYHGIKSYNPSMKRIWVEMDEGDTVLFHPILFHGSGTNRTKGFRKAISCHYAASECEYIDIKGTIQEEHANELIEMAKKGRANKFEVDRVQDIWKIKARLVAGEIVNM